MTPAGIEPATFRFVAQHLSHCATAVPLQDERVQVMFKRDIPVVLNITLLTNFVNLQYNIYYTGTDTYKLRLLLIECHHFYSKLILTILKIPRLSRKTPPSYLSKKSYRRYFIKKNSTTISQ